jgi:hypothetical protein
MNTQTMLFERRYIAIYLNDHLAGATGGYELARRSRARHEGSELGEYLADLSEQIGEEREQLREIMRFLDIGEDRLKQLAAWGGEKAGRLKLNGELTAESPPSTLVELEGLYLGVTGKLSLWRNLQRAIGERLDRFDLPELIARAERQREQLDRFKLEAAAEVLDESRDPEAAAS